MLDDVLFLIQKLMKLKNFQNNFLKQLTREKSNEIIHFIENYVEIR